jgi:hypothetical protein
MLHQECLSTLPQVQSLSVFDKVVLRIEVEMCAASYKFLAALSDLELAEHCLITVPEGTA